MMTLEFHQVELRYESLRSVDQKKEKRLLGSLSEHGQQTPVVVIKGEGENQFVLVDGYKRVRAQKKLASDTVMATLWDLSEADALVFERLLRMDQDDSALSQGCFVRALIEGFGLSAKQLSVRLDRSESWVSRRLGLVKVLPEAAIELVRTGKVCAHAAEKFLVPLARAKNADCLAFAQAAAKSKLSVRQVGDLYRGFVSGSEKARALVLADPGLFLAAQAEAPAQSQEKPPLELVLDDFSVMTSVCRRIQRRLLEPALLLHLARKEPSVSEAFSLAKASIQQLERLLGGGVIDARPGNADSNSQTA